MSFALFFSQPQWLLKNLVLAIRCYLTIGIAFTSNNNYEQPAAVINAYLNGLCIAL